MGLIASTQNFVFVAAMDRDVIGTFSDPMLVETDQISGIVRFFMQRLTMQSFSYIR